MRHIAKAQGHIFEGIADFKQSVEVAQSITAASGDIKSLVAQALQAASASIGSGSSMFSAGGSGGSAPSIGGSRILTELDLASPTITVELTGDVTGSGSATLEHLANGTISIETNVDFIDGVQSFNTRTGPVVLLSSDVTDALTYTPLSNTSPLFANNIVGTVALANNSAYLNGQLPSFYMDLANATGILPAARLSGTYTITATQANNSTYLNGQNAAYYRNYNNLTNVPTTFTPSSHTHPISDVVNLQSTLDGKQNSLGYTAENVANKNIANGYAGLDAGGKLLTSVLPDMAISNTSVVASQAAMLALTAQVGDVAIRTDVSKTYILSSNSPTTLADWKEMLSPAAPVLSVAGLTGNISAVALKAALSLAISDTSGLQTALDAKANLSGAIFTGQISVRTDPAYGNITLTTGSASQPGYAEFYSPGGIRRGYIGYGSGTNLLIHSENGWNWNFTQRPLFNGATPWDSNNLTPGNYAPIASPSFTGFTTIVGPRPRVLFDDNSYSVGSALGMYEIEVNGDLAIRRNTSTARDFSTVEEDLTISTSGVVGFRVTPNVAGSNIWHAGTFDPTTKQNADAGLTSLAGLTGAGVVTATATDAFAMRAIGAASSTDILDRASADARYTLSGTASVSSFNTRTGAVTLTSGDVTTALAYTPLSLSPSTTSWNTVTGNIARIISSSTDAPPAIGGSTFGFYFPNSLDNGYGFQFAGRNNTALIRGREAGVWGTWHTLWHSGNDGSGSGLDADTVDSYNTATAATASTLAVRDTSGQLAASNILLAGSGGIYPSGTNAAIYLPNSTYWALRTNHATASALQFQNSSGAAVGYVWSDSTNFGLLDSSQNWAVRWNPVNGLYFRLNGVADRKVFNNGENNVYENGRHGLVGVYDAAQTQAIWAMGAAYVLPVGGASNNYGSHYGLAWSYNPDYGVAGNNPQSKVGLGHQLLIQSAGVTQTAIGAGIWTNGNITAQSGSILTQNALFPQVHGNGIKFWESAAYSIYMSDASNGSFGGRLLGETTSDYNMYFKMTSGTNRGFVYMNGATPVAGIDGAGNIRANGFVRAKGAFTDLGNAGGSTQVSRYLLPGGAAYTTQSSSVTGAIRIKLPNYASNAMMRMRVEVYNYVTGTSSTFVISGYPYTAGAWTNVACEQFTDTGAPLSVRWGHDGTNNVIWIGETTTVWTYPQVHVTQFTHGYAGYGDSWTANWGITFVTAFDTVTAGPRACAYHWNSNNQGVGSGMNADMVDGHHASTSNEVANALAVRNSSGYLSQRVIQNVGPGTADGMYIGYGNTGGTGSITRIYGGGSTAAALNVHSNNVDFNGSRVWYDGNIPTDVWQTDQSGVDRFYFAASGNTVLYSLNGYHFRNSSNTDAMVISNSNNVTVTGGLTATTVSATSDRRRKKAIIPLGSASKIVDEMIPSRFTWKKTNKKSIGFIAQDMQKILPEAVQTAEDGTLSVEHLPVIAVLTRSLQETRAEIKELRSLIESLTNGAT